MDIVTSSFANWSEKEIKKKQLKVKHFIELAMQSKYLGTFLPCLNINIAI
jgi:hypothetical protein